MAPSPHPEPSLPLGNGVVRTADFAARPPSPPFLHVPSAFFENTHPSLALAPSPDSVASGSLTAQDLHIITNGQTQHASNPSETNWRYEDRRRAQAVLDWLYLGPSAAARDRAFLRREGITMLLAIRDGSMAQIQMLSIDKVSAELGIEAAYVDVPERPDLVRFFPAAVAKINEHLLRVHHHHHRAQAQAQAPDGQMVIVNNNNDNTNNNDKETSRRGKVLLFCETGNERSAAIAAAYLMALYGCPMVTAVQFVSARRFCINLNEDIKYQLRAFGDILVAERMTAQHRLVAGSSGQEVKLAPSSASSTSAARKRPIDDTMDEDEDDEFAMDQDRYENRAAFVPYVQSEMDSSLQSGARP